MVTLVAHKEPWAAEESWEQGRALIGCQMVSPENMHSSDGIWTEKVIFKNKYAYMYTFVLYVHNNNKRRENEFE